MENAEEGSAGASPTGLLRHTVLPAPAAAPLEPERTVPVPETGLLDVVLCDHRHTLTLFNHFTLAVAQGNTHAMELLAGALAIDIRLHAQAVLDVLCPLLARRYATHGAQQAALLQGQLQAVERDVLEMLTFRRERDWRDLAERTNLAHQHFAEHVHGVEVSVLPRLAADMAQEELVSSGLLFQQQKQTASLMPNTGAAAFSAAAAVGPEHATVLGDPLLAGTYQTHTHAHAVAGSQHLAGGGGSGGGACGQQAEQVQHAEQGLQQAQHDADVQVSWPDQVVTPSQQVTMGEEL